MAARCLALIDAMGAVDKTVAELASQSGVSERNIYTWREQGCMRPQAVGLNRIAESLDVEPQTLRSWLTATATADNNDSVFATNRASLPHSIHQLQDRILVLERMLHAIDADLRRRRGGVDGRKKGGRRYEAM